MTITSEQLPELQAKVDSYVLRKDKLLADELTLEDIVIIGLRKIDREKRWQAKHGSGAKKARIAELEAKLAKYEQAENGGDEEEEEDALPERTGEDT